MSCCAIFRFDYVELLSGNVLLEKLVAMSMTELTNSPGTL